MEIKRLFDVIQYQLENFPQEDALAAKESGSWRKYSTQEIIDSANQLSMGLLALGCKSKDKIGLISFNRPEWVITDLAITQIGGIDVPMYPNSTPEDYAYIIKDAGIKFIFAGDEEIANKLTDAISGLDQKPKIYTFDKLDQYDYWQTLFSTDDASVLQPIQDQIKFEDLATIIYTSGTTGNPKGVMLSHQNILTNASSVSKAFPHVTPEDRTLSFLPLCHIFERTALYTSMQMGVSMYYAQSMETIGEDLKEVKPHYFATVPRLLEKVYDKIVAKGYEQTGIKKQLFFWALNLGEKYDLNKDQGAWYRMQLKLANKIIFSKWREALGGNIRFIVSGAAALQPRLARVFWAAQIKVLEAYGLTETSPGITFTRGDEKDARVGCVGIALDNVAIKIAEDGEVLTKGPCVMMGYYNNQEETDKVIDNEGWFHTGDVGEIVEERFLKITDRKKEIFKTSGGKYIAPQAVENKFKESLLIEQLIVVGENQKFPAALITPAFDALKEWCSQKKIAYTSDSEMIEHPKVLEKFDREILKLNESFAQYEKIKKYKLLPNAWTIDNGELTPTLKLKRKVIMANYENEINSLF